MALPLVLFNSATGSDTTSSGAGPSTALSGTHASNASGVISLATDAPNLSGVAADGSALLYVAGLASPFGKIVAVDNSAKTVTIDNLSTWSGDNKSWAIGGKRASIGGTDSARIFSTGTRAGFILEMESGHTETVTAAIVTGGVGGGGNTTDGPVILRGTSGAATLPLLTFSNNGRAFDNGTNTSVYWQFRDFEMRNSNATKTASTAFYSGGLGIVIKGVKVNHSTDYFWRIVDMVATTDSHGIYDCDLGYAADVCIRFPTTGRGPCCVVNNWIHNATSHGVFNQVSAATHLCTFLYLNNIIANNGGDGINMGDLTSDATRTAQFIGNTFHGNTGDGLELASISTSTCLRHLQIENNIFTNNGGYGINWSGSGINNTVLTAYAVSLKGNMHNGNTSGFLSASITTDTNTTAADPSYTNSGGNDYSVGTAAKAVGYPVGGTLYVGKSSSTYSYLEPGVSQRQEVAASGGSSYYMGE